MQYDRNADHSYFRDQAAFAVGNDVKALERLQRHAHESEQAVRAGEYGDYEQRDLLRTDGNGGYFVPPLWLVSDYESLAVPVARPRTS